MKVTIISSKERPGVKEIENELKKQNIEVQIWDLGKNKNLPQSDKFITLGIGSMDEKTIKEKKINEEAANRLKLLKKIPKKKMFNTIIPSGKDKQYWFLKLKGIPTVKTTFTKSIEKAVKKREGKVLKPTEGSLGQGIILPHKTNEQAIKEIEMGRSGLISQPSYFHKIAIQEHIEGNEIVKAIAVGANIYTVKYIYPNKKRNLMIQDVKVKKTELSEEEKLIVNKARKRIKTGLIGIDLIRTKKGSKVLEINSSPILTKVAKEHPEIFLKIAESVKQKKETKYGKILSKMRQGKR